MKEAREREARNVLKILNLCYNKGFVPSPDRDLSSENSRIKRLTYQASLRQLLEIMLQITANHFMAKNDVLVEKVVDATLLEKLGAAAQRFFDHPVWTSDLTVGSKAKMVDEALKKNQNIGESFKAVGLTAAYCAKLEDLSTNWAGA